MIRALVQVNGVTLGVAVPAARSVPVQQGDRVTLSWAPEAVHPLESA
jgi:hypothetical protein